MLTPWNPASQTALSIVAPERSKEDRGLAKAITSWGMVTISLNVTL